MRLGLLAKIDDLILRSERSECLEGLPRVEVNGRWYNSRANPFKTADWSGCWRQGQIVSPIVVAEWEIRIPMALPDLRNFEEIDAGFFEEAEPIVEPLRADP